jgi:PhoPQ-activated pathogenicity-related protein
LHNYLIEAEDVDTSIYPVGKKYDASRKVTIDTYVFASQIWPKPMMTDHAAAWLHGLVIYKPDNVTTYQALLFVNGGTPNPDESGENPKPQHIDFARIAAATHSIVVDLQDIPNQYLTFDDNIPRKEDSIIAYSWNRYMDDPESNPYWPAHLPMTKAIIKAMDIVQQLAAMQYFTEIQSFVVAGASKRGLATWLAALSDHRINAIVPIVIDILNTKENLNHIYASLDNHWPPAFKAYIDEKIPARINTPAFTDLMNIIDPISYLSGEKADYYKKRLSISKYIISASSDDFFVADSLSMYLDKLPGETQVRVVPNQPHYIDMKIIEDALLSYYASLVNHTPRPTLHWLVNETGMLTTVSTDTPPAKVTLWEAENPTKRDFKLADHILYLPHVVSGKCQAQKCNFDINIKPVSKGWKASFVEASFTDPCGVPFVVTTPTFVIPAAKA